MALPVLDVPAMHYAWKLYTGSIPCPGSGHMIPSSKLLQTVLMLTFMLAIMEWMDISNSSQLHILFNNLPEVGCIFDYKIVILP